MYAVSIPWSGVSHDALLSPSVPRLAVALTPHDRLHYGSDAFLLASPCSCLINLLLLFLSRGDCCLPRKGCWNSQGALCSDWSIQSADCANPCAYLRDSLWLISTKDLKKKINNWWLSWILQSYYAPLNSAKIISNLIFYQIMLQQRTILGRKKTKMDLN